MAAVRYVTIGKQVNGRPAVVRAEIAPALHLAHATIKATTGFDMAARIIQAKGGSSKSGGTHLDGAGIDYRVWGMDRAARWAVVLIFRECGFSASWDRDWTGNMHLHIGADLGSTYTRLRYQVLAARARCNGLGSGGRAARDPHPAPSQWRTCSQGAAWATKQLVTHGKPGLPSTGDAPSTPKEDTLSASEIADLKAAMKAEVWAAAKALQNGGFARPIRDAMAAETATLVAHNGLQRPVLELIGESAARQTGAILDGRLTALRGLLDEIRAAGGGAITDDMLARVDRTAHDAAFAGGKEGAEAAIAAGVPASITIGGTK